MIIKKVENLSGEEKFKRRLKELLEQPYGPVKEFKTKEEKEAFFKKMAEEAVKNKKVLDDLYTDPTYG